MLVKEKITYQQNSTNLEGYLVYDNEYRQKKPAVLIAHAWRGIDNLAKNKAEELAKAGYVAFIMDLYGKGVVINNDDEAFNHMKVLFVDRALLLARTEAAYNLIKKHSLVDSQKIGAIGFCFGGLTVLEMAKHGFDLQGVVSFHGLLVNRLGELNAKAAHAKGPIKAKILVLHGYDDPLVSKEDIQQFQKEMNDKKVDWQMNVYGNTSHAFTNPEAHDTEKGLIFNPVTAKRAWKSMSNFFEEVFHET